MRRVAGEERAGVREEEHRPRSEEEPPDLLRRAKEVADQADHHDADEPARDPGEELLHPTDTMPAAPITRTSRGAAVAAIQPLSAAATATPPYPAASFRPSANPRRRGR